MHIIDQKEGAAIKFAFPFKNLPRDSWQNFALIFVASLYITLFVIVFIHSDMCGILGIDYCAFWSGGRIINERSIVDVYDLNVLTQYQKMIYPQINNSSTYFEVFPLPYLPVFVMPFQLLSLIQLPYSYLVWTLINLLGFMLYLRFFTRELIGRSLSFRLGLLIILSLPMITNVREGQLNIWLGICAGEFFRAILSVKHIQAGLWLGGWLLKPQLLVLMIPFLLIQRSFKILVGFFVATFSLLMLSLGLIGVDGFTDLADILLRSSQGSAASYPQYMMNWRMLGWHMADITTPAVGLVISIIGSVITVSTTLFFFRKPINRNPIKITLAFLGICTATTAAAWHAHVHTAIILIPPIIYLLMNDHLSKKLLLIWVIVPTSIMTLGYILSVLIEVGLMFTSISDPTFLKALGGLSILILNLICLVWAMIHYNQIKEEPTEGLSD